GARNVLDAFHQFDQAVAILDADRREADAAIAHHHRRHAMPARRIEPGVPRCLPDIIRAVVDESRRDAIALGGDLIAPTARNLSDRGDLAVFHGDVGGDEGPAQSVGNASIADDEIEFGCHGVLPANLLFLERLASADRKSSWTPENDDFRARVAYGSKGRGLKKARSGAGVGRPNLVTGRLEIEFRDQSRDARSRSTDGRIL